MVKEMIHRLGRGEVGQDYLEFAVIIPILMIILMGIVDFGRVFNSWLLVTHSAREGARYAAVGNSDADIIARATATMAGVTATVVISPTQADRVQGQPIAVGVSADVGLLSGFIAATLGVTDSYRVASQAEMRYEGPPIN